MNYDFELHDRENNEGSESFLKEHHSRLTRQCTQVFKLLNRGEHLTVPKAMAYGILSLPRRIMDIRTTTGFKKFINDKWLKDTEGKRIMKEWLIPRPKRLGKKELHKKLFGK